MVEDLKALIVVLALAVPAFYVGRQLAASVISPREFAVWRNLWFAVTAAAFLSGSFLVFAAIMLMICFYARAKRAATAALFLVLLLAVPLVQTSIPGFGLINYLFEIDNGRLLAIVLLLPIVFATGRLGRRNGRAFVMPDRFIVGYVLLLFAIQTQRSEVTQFMRSGTLLTLDILIPYFAFSRTITSVADLRKVLLAFIIAALPLSLIAVFELAKGWLLYGPIVHDWADHAMTRYLARAGLIRPYASTASSIVLGFIIMTAIGCVLAVRQSMGSRTYSGIALAILGAGLVASLARGPWVGAIVLVLVYLATSPNAAANLLRFAVIGAAVLLLLLLTPVGQHLLDLLPFIGSAETGSVTFRQLLFDDAIVNIERNPWFGTIRSDLQWSHEMLHMTETIHYVDIVNTYLEIALDFGLVSLGVFLGFFATILIGLWRVLKFEAVLENGFRACIRASMATLVAMMVTIGTVSFIDYVPYVCWSFAGLCVAVIRIANQERAEVARAADAIRVPA